MELCTYLKLGFLIRILELGPFGRTVRRLALTQPGVCSGSSLFCFLQMCHAEISSSPLYLLVYEWYYLISKLDAHSRGTISSVLINENLKIQNLNLDRRNF